MRRALPPAVLAVALLGLGGAAGAASPARTATVRLQNTAVAPSTVTIARGGRVTWRFLDGPNDEAHNVTSEGRLRFASSPDRKTGTYTVRFTRPGTYAYMCTIHFNMRGRVVVR